ncbi:hypothetical protein BGZ81_002214 [Podila clonocystis]|nr:hypothetical protein BGZ81_002214 [Podila clonocystis]
MLHISNVTRPDRFLNEAASFVNTTGSMSFNMTSPELLNLAHYQQTLRKLIHILASVKTTNSQQQEQPDGLKRVFVGTGGTFVLDTSVIDDHLQLSSSSSPSSKLYPLSFVASGPVPQLCENTNKANHPYFLRLPLNPLTHPIQCQLSARRLCSRQVTFLDRILRRLCDASPGTFMMGYSDGLSGMDLGTEVVYSGENGTTISTISSSTGACSAPFATMAMTEPDKGGKTSLDKSITHARDHGDQELDHRVAEFVGGHVEHLAIAETLPPLVPAMAKEIKARSVLLTESVTGASQSARLEIGEDQEPLNYDFGQVDDIDQLLDVAPTVDIDELHDMLWA